MERVQGGEETRISTRGIREFGAVWGGPWTLDHWIPRYSGGMVA
jgi:hypothetical protein